MVSRNFVGAATALAVSELCAPSGAASSLLDAQESEALVRAVLRPAPPPAQAAAAAAPPAVAPSSKVDSALAIALALPHAGARAAALEAAEAAAARGEAGGAGAAAESGGWEAVPAGRPAALSLVLLAEGLLVDLARRRSPLLPQLRRALLKQKPGSPAVQHALAVLTEARLYDAAGTLALLVRAPTPPSAFQNRSAALRRIVGRG